MTIKLPNLLVIILIISIATFSTGCRTVNMSFKSVASWLPESFDPNKTILIEPHLMGEKETNRMTKFLKQYYPYNFEYASRESIRADTGRFADKNKYPFGILWGSNKSLESRDTNAPGNFKRWSMYGYFVDRINSKIYPKTPYPNSYDKEVYIALFNSIKNKYLRN